LAPGLKNSQIFHDKCGHDLLLVEEVDGVRPRLDGQVVEGQKSGRNEVEEEADNRSQTQNSGHASGQHGHGGPAEVEGLRVVHHVA